MKLYRQDGSEVELTENEVQKWLAMGLATAKPPVQKNDLKAKKTEKEV